MVWICEMQNIHHSLIISIVILIVHSTCQGFEHFKLSTLHNGGWNGITKQRSTYLMKGV